MITLNLKINNKYEKVEVTEELIFNAILKDHPKMIKTLIKTILPSYKIRDSFFTIVNKYIDFTADLVSIYPGLIVRTDLNDYAVLFLENTTINEEYMIQIINEFIYDIGDFVPENVNINKFEISKEAFLKAAENI